MKDRTPHVHPVRAVMAEMAIGLAVCAGAYLVLVDPMDAQRQQVRAEADALRLAAQSPDASMPEPQAQAALKAARATIDSLTKRAAAGRDEAAIFSGTMQLAGTCGVRVDSIQPLESRTRVRGGKPGMPGDSLHGYAIHIVGPYDSVAKFLAKLQGGDALTAIRAVRIAPIMLPGSTDQQATIEAEWFAPDCKATANAAAASVPGAAEGAR